MSKNLFAFISIFVLAGVLLPSVSLAIANIYRTKDGTSVCYEGLVPCGKEVAVGGMIQGDKCSGGTKTMVYCQFCHLFVMLNGIVKFVLINVVPYLAVLMLVAGGIMFYFGGGKPDLLNRGKQLISGVIIGLFLIYGAYMLVGVFLSILKVSQWTGLAEWADQGPFSIKCDIEI